MKSIALATEDSLNSRQNSDLFHSNSLRFRSTVVLHLKVTCMTICGGALIQPRFIHYYNYVEYISYLKGLIEVVFNLLTSLSGTRSMYGSDSFQDWTVAAFNPCTILVHSDTTHSTHEKLKVPPLVCRHSSPRL